LIGSAMLRHSFDNIITKIVYVVVVHWYGILWLLFSTLIIYEITRLFVKIPPSIAGAWILSIAAIVTIYSMINAQLIHIKKLTIPGNTNCNMVQLSDIHLGSVSINFLKRVIERTNALNPELIFITGDMVDSLGNNKQEVVANLKNLKAPVFFVTGNHEGYTKRVNVIELLSQANIKTLKDETADFNSIQIIGIDESDDIKNIGNIISKLNIDQSKFTVLLSHRPVPIKILSQMKINLALCGHTHAGQIFPFNFIVGLFYKPVSGLHKYENSWLYVTSGTGTWGPRMRLGSRSEIVLVQVRKNY
ncbi:MAG: metallophosphoesterase, partial [Sedimentisphaerales bacterium]|nr:metallophosphoesterase [Sedimentisphaerales bacterium]